MQLHTDRAIDTALLHWDRSKSTFSEEASTCRFHGAYRLWDDACDEGVWVRNRTTGALRAFSLTQVQRDREGDVQAWRFEHTATRHDGGPVFLLIFND